MNSVAPFGGYSLVSRRSWGSASLPPQALCYRLASRAKFKDFTGLFQPMLKSLKTLSFDHIQYRFNFWFRFRFRFRFRFGCTTFTIFAQTQ